jgi:hypothetical protein
MRYGTCSDCEYWNCGEANPPTTAECWLIRKDIQTDKAFLLGDGEPVLMTRADFYCSEHASRIEKKPVRSVEPA